MAATVRFVNKDAHAIALQVRGYDWVQIEGEDQLSNSSAILVSPPIFTLNAGATQTIRVVARRPSVESETAHRLLIDEIPTISDTPAINFKFRISMPIFFEPEAAAKAQLEWSISAANPAHLVLKNAGNRRIKLTKLSLILPSGRHLTPLPPLNAYTLVGTTRLYHFKPDAELIAGVQIKIAALSDSGAVEFNTTVMP